MIDVAVDPTSGDAALLVGSNTLDAARYNAKLARRAPAERISEDLDGGQGYRGPARLLADGNGGFGIVWLVVSGSIPVLLLARYSPRAGTWTVQPVFEGERF
ncbi:MAG TPA: hypothetical protein VFS42_09415, partial [Burkholderiaceae bacterium]|nr:hypothetical protein [Burkholderiaceae bacterium]